MCLRLMFISLIISSSTGMPIPEDTCGPGEYKHWSRDLACLDCTEGKNFMPENGHKNSQCYNCSQIKDPELELVHTKCNKTHNTSIVCIPGYYRSTEQETCVRCQSCNHTGRQCQYFTDSVCCPGDNYKVVDDVCELFCSAGEYLSGDKCLPCEKDHYNSIQAHRDTNCRKCQVADIFLHLIIEVPCNKTHDTVLVCERNYFLRSKPLSHEKFGECHKCLNCSVKNQYEAKSCSRDSNTVCCLEPGMIVTDSGECVENVTTITAATATTTTKTTASGPRTCGKGQYLDISFNNMNTSCLPCRHGTYQDLVNHTEAQCKNCTQYNGTESQLPETCRAQAKGTREYSNLSDGAIAGIVCGVFAFVAVVGVLFIIRIYVCRRSRQGQRNGENEAQMGGELVTIKPAPLKSQRPARPTPLKSPLPARQVRLIRPTNQQNDQHVKHDEQQPKRLDQQQIDTSTDNQEDNILETKTEVSLQLLLTPKREKDNNEDLSPNSSTNKAEEENSKAKLTPQKKERKTEYNDETINYDTFDYNIGEGLRFMDASDTDTEEDDLLT